jgi:hypothetical protein
MGNVFVVEITHKDTDSFSRSVFPTSTRAWRKHLSRDEQFRTTYRHSIMGHTKMGRMRVSTVTFGPSFASARAVAEAGLPEPSEAV